jgi:hypothetical protein
MAGIGKTVANILSPITGLFGGGEPTAAPAPAPSVTPPTPMPDEKMKTQAKRRSIVEQRARQGRASTILTDTSNDTLGG